MISILSQQSSPPQVVHAQVRQFICYLLCVRSLQAEHKEEHYSKLKFFSAELITNTHQTVVGLFMKKALGVSSPNLGWPRNV